LKWWLKEWTCCWITYELKNLLNDWETK